MDPIDYFYVALAVVYALALAYMFTYTRKVSRRQKALLAMGQHPVHTQAGAPDNLPAASEEMERGRKHT